MKWNHYALVHNTYYNGTSTNWVYLNGKLSACVGGDPGGLDSTMIRFDFAGYTNMVSSGVGEYAKDYKDVAIYRTSKTDDEIADLYNGFVHRASLECFTSFSEQNYYPYQVLKNDMPVNNGIVCYTNSPSLVPLVESVPAYTYSVGGSPFNVTNTSGQSFNVYVNHGTNTSILLNGIEMGGMTNSANQYNLHPNDILTITYSAAPFVTSK